jgi:hypothetical protein
MSRELVAYDKSIFDQLLHPKVCTTAVGLDGWFALWAWVLFDWRSDIDLSLAMVTAVLWSSSWSSG